MIKLSDCEIFSSRLLGQNRFFNTCGAILDISLTKNIEKTAEGFASIFTEIIAKLPIKEYTIVVDTFSSGFSLAISYPFDLMYTMCDIMDHIWESFAKSIDDGTPVDLEYLVEKFKGFIKHDKNMPLRKIYIKAAKKKINCSIFKEDLVIGSGKKSFSIKLKKLKKVSDIPWEKVGDIPILLVTGTNGKTTTVRLTEFICRTAKMKTGECDSDFVMINGKIKDEGDLSGPTGHLTVLSNPKVEVAILEAARGGLVKRGLMPNYALAATVTNIAHDHIGQNGVDNLSDLANLKSIVYSGIKQDGIAIVNLDDKQLSKLQLTASRKAFISTKLSEAKISTYLTPDNFIVFIYKGKIVIKSHNGSYLLNKLTDIPLTVNGLAKYNYENILHAVALSFSLGCTPKQIVKGLTKFGANDKSNFGRWNYFKTPKNGHLVIDTAHNPAGLNQVLKLANDFRKLHKLNGRLGLMYGITGDRRDTAPTTAKIISDNKVDHVVIKEILSTFRGSTPGEMPKLLKQELEKIGYPKDKIKIISVELENAKFIINQSKPDDIYILCVHEMVPETISLIKNLS